MRPLLLAVQAGREVTLGLRAQVRPALMGLPALRCRAMVASAARAVLEAPAETVALVEQEAVEPQAAGAVVVLVRRPSAASVVSVASAVRASTPRA
jgi:hypothetical protein